MRYSACIEMLFAPEFADPVDRVFAAAAAGFDAFEFWSWSNKDLPAIRAARDATGLTLAAFLAEPMIAITDPANHEAFLEGLQSTVEHARELAVPTLIAQTGNDRSGVPRLEQHRAIVDCLGLASEILAGSGVRLGIEPLNTRVNHPGYFLDSTTEGLDIVDEVARPEIGIVYDLYHSLVMGESPAEVLEGRMKNVLHVHVADQPGRHQPGTGDEPLTTHLQYIIDTGFDGFIGFEYRPIGDSTAAAEGTLALFERDLTTRRF